MSDLSADWARFSDGVCGAKLHIVYDCDAEHPIDAAITPARLNDITATQTLPITAGATYVFDLGYYDFAWWARLDDAGCRIVTRFKSNTRLTMVAENRVSDDVRPHWLLGGEPRQPVRGPGARDPVRIERGKIPNGPQQPAHLVAKRTLRPHQLIARPSNAFSRWSLTLHMHRAVPARPQHLRQLSASACPTSHAGP